LNSSGNAGAKSGYTISVRHRLAEAGLPRFEVVVWHGIYAD
jgi:hypothetical protein